MAEQQDSGGGKASALRKEKKSKGKGKDAGDEFPLSTKHMVIVGVVAVLLIAMRVGYDDGSKKSQEDDLLDGQDLYEVMEISKSSSDSLVRSLSSMIRFTSVSSSSMLPNLTYLEGQG